MVLQRNRCFTANQLLLFKLTVQSDISFLFCAFANFPLGTNLEESVKKHLLNLALSRFLIVCKF